MMPSNRARTNNLQPVFLGYRWIEDSIAEYRKGNRKLAPLMDRTVMFSERHFAAALIHLYVGTFSLSEIADLVSITEAELAFLRTQIDFMTLVDSTKVSFTRHFREKLISNDYSLIDYASIGAEYAVFEELARNQIRIPLFKRMKHLASSIAEKERQHLHIDLYDLRSFKKLFCFFVFEECFVPALAKPRSQQFKTIAEGIVWKMLEEDYDELDALLSSNLVTQGVRDDLKKLLMSLV